jgi:hypothetical protein
VKLKKPKWEQVAAEEYIVTVGAVPDTLRIVVHRHAHTLYQVWHYSCRELAIQARTLSATTVGKAKTEALGEVLGILNKVVEDLRYLHVRGA